MKNRKKNAPAEPGDGSKEQPKLETWAHRLLNTAWAVRLSWRRWPHSLKHGSPWPHRIPWAFLFKFGTLVGTFYWCITFIESHLNRVQDRDAHFISRVMFGWALGFTGLINFSQYFLILLRDYAAINKLGRWRVVLGYVFVVLIIFSVGILLTSLFYSSDLVVPLAPNGFIPAKKNIIFLAFSFLFLIIDVILKQPKTSIKMEAIILTSLICGTVFLARIQLATQNVGLPPDMLSGYNTGMLVFHMTLATLLFEIQHFIAPPFYGGRRVAAPVAPPLSPQ